MLRAMLSDSHQQHELQVATDDARRAARSKVTGVIDMVFNSEQLSELHSTARLPEVTSTL